jgi:hypothetical protein
VKERAIDESGDLRVIEIEVPWEDKRPAVRPGSIKADPKDVQEGNPLKNGGNPEDLEV